MWQALGENWYVVMEWPDGVEDGGPGRMVIEPVGSTHPVGGLSSTVLRQINFKEAIEEFRNQLAVSEKRSQEREVHDEWRAERVRAALTKGVTDDYLVLLALQYVRAVQRGQANVNDYLAAQLGKPVSTIRGHLGRARRQGYLSGSPGHKGGELSDDARAIIRRINGTEPAPAAALAVIDDVAEVAAKFKSENQPATSAPILDNERQSEGSLSPRRVD